MKRRIGLLSALFAAILLFTGCAAPEKKDPVQDGSSRSEGLNDKKPQPDTQSALSPSAPTSDTKGASSPSAPTPDTESKSSPPSLNPAPEAQKTEMSTVTYLITTKNGCNVRSGPKEKSKRLVTLKRGVKLQKIGQSENWYNIILPSGEKGWIHKDLVKNAN
jgi:uncharacterized protein YgiM (DUF1202 family)